MNILQIGILVFIVIETSNILVLYLAPGLKKANGLGVFTAWEKAREDESMAPFARYMAAWVAGTKLIFILVGGAVILWGNIEIQLATAGALALSISSFFWQLYPIIRKMDREGRIVPAGYSRTLTGMIIAFIAGFLVIFGISMVQYLR